MPQAYLYVLTQYLVAASVLAAPSPVQPDPAGTKNIGNGAGQQFIGGECLSSNDCAETACCAFNDNGRGVCSGLGAQNAAGKTGCGFGDGGASPATSLATSAAPAATSVAAAPNTGNAAGGATDSSAPGSQNVGTGNGQQFITGQCLSDADCASGCCANPNGVCSAVAVAFDSGKQGCGFTSTGVAAAEAPAEVPAEAFAAAAGAVSSSAPAVVAADVSATATGVDSAVPGSQNVGTGNGQQFITGQCFSDADCASGCCANPKGVCSAVAVAFDSGKQGCGFTTAGASPAADPAVASPVAAPATGSTTVTVDTTAPGSENVGTANGQQFITGQCLSDADCASGCCANPKGVCSAVAVAFDSGKQGCGFVGTAA